MFSTFTMWSRQPPPRESHAAVGIGQKLYIWGGVDNSSDEAPTTIIETFDVPSVTWLQPGKLSSPLPSGVEGMAVTSDGVRAAYCYGGRIGSDTYLNTIHQVNPATQQCRELVPKDPSYAPKKTSGSCIVCFDQRLVVHGGFTGQDWTNQLRVFDLRTSEWSPQPTTGETPPPLAGHTFTKIDHYRAVVFGGYNGRTTVNDTHVLNVETWHWTKLGSDPPARASHTTCCIVGPYSGERHPLLMVIGGWDTSKRRLGDVWLLDVDKGMWSEVGVPVDLTPRGGHSAVSFGSGPNFRLVVLFGGSGDGYQNYISETTPLLLEFKRGTWQVIRVVKTRELGRPNKKLREQLSRLEFPHEEGSEDTHQSQSTRSAVPSTANKPISSSTHS